MSAKILVVCSTNHCRSPFAAALLNYRAEQRGIDLQASSAGAFAGQWARSADHRAQACALSYGIDLSRHRTAEFTASAASEVDLLLVLDLDSAQFIRSVVSPFQFEKVRHLVKYGRLAQNEIPDPVLGEESFEETFRLIAVCIDSFLSELPGK